MSTWFQSRLPGRLRVVAGQSARSFGKIFFNHPERAVLLRPQLATCGCSACWPDARTATSGSQYHAGHGIQLLEEDLAMSDRIPAAGDADDQRGSEPDMSATDEFAKMRAVMRASEKHREGGVDPELEVADADPGPDT